MSGINKIGVIKFLIFLAIAAYVGHLGYTEGQKQSKFREEISKGLDKARNMRR